MKLKNGTDDLFQVSGLAINIIVYLLSEENGIELLSRSGAMEAAQTPEPITFGRGDQIFA